MKKSTWIVPLLGSVLVLSAGALRAQEPAPGPGPGPDMMGPGGPIGGRMEILGFGEMHPGKVVTGAPYSAVAVIESTQILSDGNSINRKVQTSVFRDGQALPFGLADQQASGILRVRANQIDLGKFIPIPLRSRMPAPAPILKNGGGVPVNQQFLFLLRIGPP